MMCSSRASNVGRLMDEVDARARRATPRAGIRSAPARPPGPPIDRRRRRRRVGRFERRRPRRASATSKHRPRPAAAPAARLDRRHRPSSTLSPSAIVSPSGTRRARRTACGYVCQSSRMAPIDGIVARARRRGRRLVVRADRATAAAARSSRSWC